MDPHEAAASEEWGYRTPYTHTMVESIPQALLPVETMAQVAASAVVAQVVASAVVVAVVAQVAASNWTSEF